MKVEFYAIEYGFNEMSINTKITVKTMSICKQMVITVINCGDIPISDCTKEVISDHQINGITADSLSWQFKFEIVLNAISIAKPLSLWRDRAVECRFVVDTVNSLNQIKRFMYSCEHPIYI